MLTLITGLPGAGKTLNLIKMIDSEPEYKNRPIYYFNIKELKLDWIEIDEKQALAWYDLPDNSIVIMDECQRLFRPMKYGDKVPRAIEEFETHRHRGFDIFLITQNPKLIDTKVRYLCGQHINYERQYGFGRVRKVLWQKAVNDTEDYHARLEAEISRIRLDKKYFGVYKSTEVNTHKAKIPRKLYFVILFAIIPFAVLGYLYNKYSSGADASDSSVAAVNTLFSGDVQSYEVAQLSYEDQMKPRVMGLPHTAPFYDQVTKPVTFPRPQCVYQEGTSKCNCYSQQGTKMSVHFEMCVSLVKNGWFDYTKKESKKVSENNGLTNSSSNRPSLAQVEHSVESMIYDVNGFPHSTSDINY
jgi:zona occludens toxin